MIFSLINTVEVATRPLGEDAPLNRDRPTTAGFLIMVEQGYIYP